MTTQATDPIHDEWLTDASSTTHATAGEVNALLCRREVADLDDAVLPALAASGAELASIAEIPWRFTTDDPAVSLLRLISRIALSHPDAAGPHTTRLARQLR